MISKFVIDICTSKLLNLTYSARSRGVLHTRTHRVCAYFENVVVVALGLKLDVRRLSVLI